MGHWILNFTVTNNLSADMAYFFGVDVAGGTIVGSPIPIWNNGATWTNYHTGSGSSIVYNDNWWSEYGGVAPGTSQSGFDVLSTAAVAPTNVAWFAYGLGSVYNGGGCFYCGTGNPGFEGQTASTTIAAPEPISMALLGTGILGLGVVHRRRTRSISA